MLSALIYASCSYEEVCELLDAAGYYLGDDLSERILKIYFMHREAEAYTIRDLYETFVERECDPDRYNLKDYIYM